MRAGRASAAWSGAGAGARRSGCPASASARTSSTAPSPPRARTGSGSPTSPTSEPGRAGSISPPSRTSSRAGSWAGRWPITCAPSSSSTRLQMALEHRRPEPGLVHHSDQGSQYVSLAFGQTARAAGIAQSMGSRGDCFDNAVAESFFATLKKELVNRRPWPTESRATQRDLRLHRDLLQPPTTPRHARHALARRLREQHSQPRAEQTSPLRGSRPPRQ